MAHYEINDQPGLLYEARSVSPPKPKYGARQHRRSIRILIGIAILLALSVALYEFRGTYLDTNASSANRTISQDVANNTHVPERL